MTAGLDVFGFVINRGKVAHLDTPSQSVHEESPLRSQYYFSVRARFHDELMGARRLGQWNFAVDDRFQRLVLQPGAQGGVY